MRVLLITDAWHPQVNGVVRTYGRVVAELERLGHTVRVVSPGEFRTVPAPSYPEIRLAVSPGRRLRRIVAAFQPDAIHLATEGPLGWAGRRYCLQRGLPYTTSFTTRFPEYLHARWRLPLAWSYGVLKRFHGSAARVMVATETIRSDLRGRGFTNLADWTRGVDTESFRPQPKSFLDMPRPVHLYAGRVAVEKNIEAFLTLELPGSKVVVGSGPQLASLQQRYPDVHFAGYRVNGELSRYYAAADVFVFPSRTDTFGLVMLEALASGVPVAAYPVPGPLDVLTDPAAGVIDEDLGAAVRKALQRDPEACRRHALRFSWGNCARMFLENLAPFTRQGHDEPSHPVQAASVL